MSNGNSSGIARVILMDWLISFGAFITTSKSTSLSGPASPRACEPNKMTRSGSNRFAISLASRRITSIGTRIVRTLVGTRLAIGISSLISG